MQVDFAFICDYAEATNKINALGIGFDTIMAARVPTRHPHFFSGCPDAGHRGGSGREEFRSAPDR